MVYPEICIEAWSTYSKSLKEKCGERCQDEFLHHILRSALIDKFYGVMNKVRSNGTRALIIDLTHNGGGTDWVKDVTALLTENKLLCGRRGFVKHSHYVKIFTDDLNELKSAPQKNSLIIKEAERKIKIASDVCDRTLIWTQKGFNLTCSAVGYYDGDSCKYEELKFHGKTKYKGKLFFLVDDYTASAAEDIVARYLDSKAATIIGAHTTGSGCGYVNGGIKFHLPNSGLVVKTPDCIRERADGTNEVVGIEPDIQMDMNKIGDSTFLSQLIDKIAEQIQ